MSMENTILLVTLSIRYELQRQICEEKMDTDDMLLVSILKG